MKFNPFSKGGLSFNWKQRGGIILPRTLQPPFRPSESEFVNLYIPYRDIFGVPKSFDDLKKQVESIPIEPALILLSKLNLLLNRPDFRSSEFQATLVQPLFPADILSRIIRKLNSTDTITVFAHHRQVLFLQKNILLYSSVTGENMNLSASDLHSIGTALLLANEVLDKDFSQLIADDVPAEKERREMLLWGLKNMQISSSEQALHLIVRYYQIFQGLPQLTEIRSLTDFQNTNYDSLFLEATGIPMNIYIFLGVAMYGLFLQYSQNNGNGPFNIGEETFNKVSNPRIRQAAFSQFTADLRLAREELKKEEAIRPNETYVLRTFRKYPLFRLSDNRVICLSPHFLVDKISSGIYWIMFDYLKNKDEARWQAFQRLFGKLFERYIQNLCLRMLGGQTSRVIPEVKYFKRKEEFQTSDVLLLYPKTLVLVEVVGSRLSMLNTLIKGDYASYETDAHKLVIGKAKQISRVIQDFKDGHFHIASLKPTDINSYIPIIVCPESFPQNSLIWKHLTETMKRENILTDPMICPLTIIDAEEIEMAEGYVQDGKNFSDMIRAKAENSKLQHLPFKNYCFHEFRTMRPNIAMGDIFKDLGQKSAKALFHDEADNART